MSNEPQQRSKAVHEALQPLLPPASLQKAVEYWERNFEQSGSGTIHQFVTDVCESNGLATQRSQMLMAVVAAVNPERTTAANGPIAEAGTSPADDAQVCAFENLITHLPAQMDGLTGEQLRADLIGSLRPHRFPDPFISRFRGWLLHRRSLRPVEVSASGLRATVDQLYVLMAERLGPVETDRILHEASQRTRDDSPELAQALARLR